MVVFFAVVGFFVFVGAVFYVCGVLKWMAVETVAGYRYGDFVVGVTAVSVRGVKVVYVENGIFIFVECVDGVDFIVFMLRFVKCDYRILVVEMNVLG